MSYTIIDTADRDAWLKARESVLTATDIARLYCGGPAEWRNVREEKNGHVRDFDTKYMAWGRKREPILNDYATTFVDSRLRPNDRLLISEEDMRIGATPDLVGDRVAGEDKTSKHPMPSMKAGLDLRGQPLRYYVQMQVQALVTGAEAVVLTWEQHDDEWLDVGGKWPEPTPLHIDHQVVLPDPAAFRAIGEIVERYHTEQPAVSAEVGRIVHELRKLDYEGKQLKSRQDELRDMLKAEMGEGGQVAVADGSVAYYTPKPRVSFDSARFREEYPELWTRYQVKKETAPTLRVTFAKDEE